MNTYRITKYNPIYRKNGVYTRDEWTDYSDIGKNFEEGILTEKEYIKTEHNYVSCIVEILEFTKVKNLFVEGYEEAETNIWKNGQKITKDLLPKISKDCLRNKCWCRLISDKYFINFGYDYYMYVGCNLTYEEVLSVAKKYNLFCEEVDESPYSPQEDEE